MMRVLALVLKTLRLVAVFKLVSLIRAFHRSGPRNDIENCAIFNLSTPSGGYSYLSNWLNELANGPISFPPGLARAIFDNNQKVGRTYIITGDNKVPTTTMTSHLWLTLDESSRHQEIEELMPKNWMWKEKSDTILSALLENISDSNIIFCESRDIFLKECIEIVYLQHENSNTDCIDKILDEIKVAASEKLCENCGCECDQSFRICRSCGESNLTRHTIDKNTLKLGL